jgi:hypothetical protein
MISKSQGIQVNEDYSRHNDHALETENTAVEITDHFPHKDETPT